MSELAQALPGEFIRITTDRWTEPFWQAAKEGWLTAAQCGDCGHFRMPPSPFCPECLSQKLEWPKLTGRGELFSYCVCTRTPFPGRAADMLYIPAIVELPDAARVRLVANLVDVAPEDVSIGMALQVRFHEISEGWKIPIFAPA